MPLPVRTAHRYVTPLREGGSLPAIVDTDAGLYVTKFRGAGQGARALIAEILVGGLAERLGLPLPEVAVVEAPEGFGRTEPDAEIQDILKASRGTNVGLAYVEGAYGYDPVAVADLVAPDLAADVVWLDALVTNIDRTAKNPNLLVTAAEGGGRLWLIDHGAALYFHHNWDTVDEARARSPFAPIRDHVLLPVASSIADADARLAPRLNAAAVDALVALVPDGLLMHAPEGRTPPFDSAAEARRRYAQWLGWRLDAPRAWVDAAETARTERASDGSPALPYRR